MGLDGVDLTDLDNFASGFPHGLFALHRREAPVYWHEPTANTPDNEGFWSVATYAETLEVLRDPVTYSSHGPHGEMTSMRAFRWNRRPECHLGARCAAR